MSGVSAKEFLRRYRKALSVPFDLHGVCSATVQEFVSASSSALGCSEKCFFLPLLTCAASCLGTESVLELTPAWREPPVLWTLVLCPRSLLRVDVAEYFKQQVLCAQERALVLGKGEDTKEYLKKFLFDSFTLDRLQDSLKLSHGHGLAVYSSARSLHPNLSTPEQADALHRMHQGNAWFTDSRVSRMTLSKTRVNFAVVCTPSSAHHELSSAPNFAELFHQCFFVTCAEENHAKFGQISADPEPGDKLLQVFVSLLQLHAGSKGEPPILYRLGEGARDKFSQIHDELTDKARQLARKNAHRVFPPAVAYLLRLALALHVLDAVLEAINFKVPLSRLTWSTEISGDTLWQARELLGHMIAQRHCLMEPTGMEGGNSPKQGFPTVHSLVEGGPPLSTPSPHRSPALTVRSPAPQTSPRFSVNNARRNILNVRPSRGMVPVRPFATPLITNAPPPPVVNGGMPSSVTPIISSVCSAGVAMSLPSTLSVSSVDSPLLSRPPFASLQDLSEADFLSAHRSSLRRLLRCSAPEVTPSRCVQQSLTPDPTASDEATRFTKGFARAFLKRLETSGFGLCEASKSGNVRSFVFKKKKFSALGEDQRKVLDSLKISEVEYNKCFTTKEQNGNVVCLE